jgi:hypothetical protein
MLLAAVLKLVSGGKQSVAPAYKELAMSQYHAAEYEFYEAQDVRSLPAAFAIPAERAAFIRRVYAHVAGALLAFVAIEYLLLVPLWPLSVANLDEHVRARKLQLAGRAGAFHAGGLAGGKVGDVRRFASFAVCWPGCVHGCRGDYLPAAAVSGNAHSGRTSAHRSGRHFDAGGVRWIDGLRVHDPQRFQLPRADSLGAFMAGSGPDCRRHFVRIQSGIVVCTGDGGPGERSDYLPDFQRDVSLSHRPACRCRPGTVCFCRNALLLHPPSIAQEPQLALSSAQKFRFWALSGEKRSG